MSIVHIPFYPSDWLAGTRGLSDVETGVYITLIARMYEMAAPIERDDNRLYRLCGSKSKASFVKALEYLMSEGKITETPNGLFNEKVSKVIQQTVEKSDKAKVAAQSRWGRKSNEINSGQDADASTKHMPQTCYPEPEPYKKESTNVLLANTPPAIDEISEAVLHFNEVATAVGWPNVAKISPARRSALRCRISDAGGLAAWIELINRASRSGFLTGDNNRGWKADFDFLSKAAKFNSLIEGSYDNRTPVRQSTDDFHTHFAAALGGDTDGPQRANEIDPVRAKRLSAPL